MNDAAHRHEKLAWDLSAGARVKDFKIFKKSAIETQMFSNHKKKLVKARRQKPPARRQVQVTPANQEPVPAPGGPEFDIEANLSSNRDSIVSIVLRRTMNTTHTV